MPFSDKVFNRPVAYCLCLCDGWRRGVTVSQTGADKRTCYSQTHATHHLVPMSVYRRSSLLLLDRHRLASDAQISMLINTAGLYSVGRKNVPFIFDYNCCVPWSVFTARQLITERSHIWAFDCNKSWWPWTSIYCFVIRVMCVSTKRLRLESRGFCYKVALYLSYQHIKFDDQPKGNSFEF